MRLTPFNMASLQSEEQRRIRHCLQTLQPALAAFPFPKRLQAHLPAWETQINDPWVTEIIREGLKPELKRPLPKPQRHQPRWRRPRTSMEAESFKTHLTSFLAEGVVRAVGRSTKPLRKLSWLSRLFSVPKPGCPEGRPCLNLKPLNRYGRKHKFKMETLKDLRTLLRRGDFLTKIDISKAFHHIPLSRKLRRLLRFEYEGVIYEFLGLPFGLMEAPRIFTQILRRLAAKLRLQGLRTLFYLDDILITGRSYTECLRNTRIAVELLTSLGFTISPTKSCFTPSRRMEYLGFLVDTANFVFTLTPQKRRSFRHRVARILNANAAQRRITLRDLSSIVGTLTSLSLAYLQTADNLTDLKADLRMWTRRCSSDYKQPIVLSEVAIRQLTIWRHLLADGPLSRPIRLDAPEIVIDTDACPQGWGAARRFPDSLVTLGHWTEAEARFHNNWLELKGIVLGVPSLTPVDQGPLNIRVRSDNTTALAYVRHRVGRHRHFNELIRPLWSWAARHGHQIRGEFLPGVRNTIADGLSRTHLTFCEGRLDLRIFRLLTEQWFRPTLDLFASRTSRQTPRYVSRYPDHQAVATDAFSMDWTRLNKVYLNPPFALLGSVLRRLEESRMPDAILIVPLWPSAVWWPLIWPMIVDWPRILLPYVGMVQLEGSRQPPPAPRWPLVALRLSGRPRLINSWRQMLAVSSRTMSLKSQLRSRMIAFGNFSSPSGEIVVERALSRLSATLRGLIS